MDPLSGVNLTAFLDQAPDRLLKSHGVADAIGDVSRRLTATSDLPKFCDLPLNSERQISTARSTMAYARSTGFLGIEFHLPLRNPREIQQIINQPRFQLRHCAGSSSVISAFHRGRDPSCSNAMAVISIAGVQGCAQFMA